jgi:quercetin dioxygenase-like cupin family protein
MAEDQVVETQLAGLTGASHGGPERAARWVAGPVLSFDLTRELEQLHQEASWKQHGHDAKTLVKEQAFRVVLIALKAGAAVDEHHATGPISIQVLGGQLQVTALDRTMLLSVGQVLALEAGVLHAVAALADSAYLLTIAATGYGGPGPASGTVASAAETP